LGKRGGRHQQQSLFPFLGAAGGVCSIAEPELESGRAVCKFSCSAFIKRARAVLQKHQSYVLGIDDQPAAHRLKSCTIPICAAEFETKPGLLFQAARKKRTRRIRELRAVFPSPSKATRRGEQESDPRQHTEHDNHHY